MATVNEEIFDKLVRHHIGLTRLASSTAQHLTDVLNTADPQLAKVLARLDASTTKSGMNKALREIRDINTKVYVRVERELIKAMRDLAVSEAQHQHKTLMESLPTDAASQVKPKQPAKSALRSAVVNEPINGALIPEYVNGMESGRYTRMRDVIRREISAGGTDAAVNQAIRAGIIGTAAGNYKDGVLGYSRRSLDQQTHTISNGVANMARDMYVAPNDDIFDGVQWVSVLDNRTSAICQSLDGTVFPVDEGPRPPAHPNCRSEVVPVVKDWEAMGLSDLGPGTREAMDGEVPETQTYDQWLRTQSKEVQDEILGPSRGVLFRKHDITLDRFVRDDGTKWTLDELEDQGLF